MNIKSQTAYDAECSRDDVGFVFEQKRDCTRYDVMSQLQRQQAGLR